jgi:hypothetical protein
MLAPRHRREYKIQIAKNAMQSARVLSSLKSHIARCIERSPCLRCKPRRHVLLLLLLLLLLRSIPTAQKASPGPNGRQTR